MIKVFLDPYGDHVLECAFECDADAVIARDVYLPVLNKIGCTPIFSADFFLEKILLQNHLFGAISRGIDIGRYTS
jgi:hypothetical protein